MKQCVLVATPCQVIDEAKGPITRKDYELYQAPAGESLMGHVVNFLGQPHTGLTGDSASSGSNTAAAASRPGGRAREPPGAAEAEAAGADSGLLGSEATRPLINQQVAMKNRDQISESLFTGACCATWQLSNRRAQASMWSANSQLLHTHAAQHMPLCQAWFLCVCIELDAHGQPLKQPGDDFGM
jgi:hypothetical protein